MSAYADEKFKKVVSAFSELLVLKDDLTVRFVLAVYVANTFGLDPVWTFLVAPSSSAKSEFVRALSGLPGAVEISSLTSNTFLSGARGPGGDDPSLLSRVKSGDVFLLKDFTTILSMPLDIRNTLLAQLREIFDGKLDKKTGQISRSWVGKVGFIAGVTYAIEDTLMTSATYGDRFLYWKIPDVDFDAAMDRAAAVNGSADDIRETIRAEVASYFTALDFASGSLPKLPDHVAKAMRELCKFAVLGRAPVVRDKYGSRDIESVGHPESPMRLYKELTGVACGLAALRGGRWDDADWPVLSKVASDCVPSYRMNAIDALAARRDEWTETSKLGVSLGLGTAVARRHAQDLECHGLVKRFAGKKGEAHHWRLSDRAVKFLSYADTPSPAPVERETPPPPVSADDDIPPYDES